MPRCSKGTRPPRLRSSLDSKYAASTADTTYAILALEQKPTPLMAADRRTVRSSDDHLYRQRPCEIRKDDGLATSTRYAQRSLVETNGAVYLEGNESHRVCCVGALRKTVVAVMSAR